MTTSDFAALDEQKFKAFHWRATLTTGLGVFCDGYDLTSVGLVMPEILAHFGHAKLTGLESALLAASALAGAAIGGLGFGLLGQRGRKNFYGFDVLILGLAAIAQAFAPSVAALIAIRFILGIGVGGDYVLSPMIMAEHSNRANRGRAIGLGFGTMWPLGALAATLVDLALKAIGVDPDLRWRLVLAGGAIPAFAVIYLRRTMPETARYLARLGGKSDEAANVIAQISGERTAAPTVDNRPFGQVLAQHARPILAAALLWLIYDLVVYASILFGPSLIAQSLGLNAINFNLVMYLFFTLPASVLFSIFIIDQFGRKPLQAWGFVAGAVAIGVFALLQRQLAAVPILALLVFGLFNVAATGPGLVSGGGILGVELAPTRVRSVAQSITVAGGRIGATLSTFAFPLLFGAIGRAPTYWILAALGVLGALLTWLLVPETGRISLEKITGEDVLGVGAPAETRSASLA
ncbi:MAG: MFS transporter [Caulobacteraceae bacterium]|nr:MFS transporter [Caulobacteraceae bacterium]